MNNNLLAKKRQVITRSSLPVFLVIAHSSETANCRDQLEIANYGIKFLIFPRVRNALPDAIKTAQNTKNVRIWPNVLLSKQTRFLIL